MRFAPLFASLCAASSATLSFAAPVAGPLAPSEEKRLLGSTGGLTSLLGGGTSKITQLQTIVSNAEAATVPILSTIRTGLPLLLVANTSSGLTSFVLTMQRAWLPRPTRSTTCSPVS